MLPNATHAWRAGIVVVLLVGGSVGDCRFSAHAASNDDNVEWNGVYSHSTFREPLYPSTGEPFSVELRVFRGDITGARVRTWDGAERFSDMVWVRNESESDVWRGTVAASDADYLYYYFEITDGADRDYYNALGMWGSAPSRGDFFVDLTPNLGGYPLGATPVPGGTIFRVWAPNASSAAVVGNFNGWSTTANPLVRNRGFWRGFVPAAHVGHEYKFVFDGDIWRTDPRARRQVSSVGNSVVDDPDAYTWGDHNWVTPYFEDMIIYELHVGSFSGDGDGVSYYPGRYRDVVDRHLDHLLELGINVVELMPVGEFAGEMSWGYNPSFLFAPESAYGRPADLKYLVDKCHQNGIAVILDVVYNHMGGSDLAGNLLEYDGEEIYFYPPGSPYRETPWGPRLDYGRLEVRHLIRDNIRYWLEEYHLDGFRIDGTDFIKVNGDGWELLKDIAREADVVSRKAIVIAEQLPNDPPVSQSIAAGGAGLDAQWNDAFHDNLRAAIDAAAFGEPNMAGIADGINHFGLGSGTKVVNYVESHDEAAVHGRVSVAADGNDPSSEWAYGRSKVAAALVIFSAGIPMILQGQELLESRRFGDAQENRIRWSLVEEHADFFLFMKNAVYLRRTQPALRSSGHQNVFHVNDGAEVLAFQRWTDAGDDLVVVVSLANRDFDSYQLGLPLDGEWFEALNGDAAVYGGRNRGNGGRVVADGGPRDGFGQSATIVIPRTGVLVLARQPIPFPSRAEYLRGDCNGDERLDISDAARALGILFRALPAGDCYAACNANGDAVVDVSDPIYALNFLFGGGSPPPVPWPDCGWDREPGELPCERRC